MRRMFSIILAVVLSTFAPQCNFAQSGKQDSSVQKKSALESAEKIYSIAEVDKEAELKNLEAVLSEISSRIHCDGEWTLVISAVLRKSGKVTDVKVESATGCKVPSQAIAAIKKIKFTPATRGGLPVSQQYELDVKQELQLMINTKDGGVVH